MEIVRLILGVLTGKAGEQVGGAVAGVAQFATLAGMGAAVVLWLKENGDDIFLALTYKDLAFWGLVIGAMIFLTLRLVHRAPPP